ncbi:hypothetical protein HNP11_004210 [Tsukamurella ocularis]|nr:hypothetical protein [Tsukamurella ocularis]
MTGTTFGSGGNRESRSGVADHVARPGEATLLALMSRADFRAWLTASCESQKLSVVIDDWATITTVAALLK